MKVHEVIISLASNDNQEANLAKAREQLTQLMTEVHFTSAIWTEPIVGEGLLCEVLKETEKRIGRIKNEDGVVVVDLDLLEYDGQRHHLRDWSRNYVKDLLNEL